MAPPTAKSQTKPPLKAMATIQRQAISDSSLMCVPEDAVEGYEERLYRCVHWTLTGSAIRHHIEQCKRDDIPYKPLNEALKTKIQGSILQGFLDENSSLSLAEQWEVILPMILWDNEQNSTDEAKICFKNRNNITDDLLSIAKEAVRVNDRTIIWRRLKEAMVLRLHNCEMTDLDEELLKYKHLATLSLCGNYISEMKSHLLPKTLRVLELQANRISDLSSFSGLPHVLLYVGLAKNLLTEDSLGAISQFPCTITVLDLSDNDIYNLEPLLKTLASLTNLQSLQLSGNPCSVSAAYAAVTLNRLQRLKYLDNRQILKEDRPTDLFEPHPDFLRSSYFIFSVLRIMSCPVPPKLDKGFTGTFYVEMELPLLDSIRRNFLMFRSYESLNEYLPAAEDDYIEEEQTASKESTGSTLLEEVESEDTDIFLKVKPKDPLLLQHFTIFETPHVQWNKIMSFPEPLKIFCPDLTALRDTFRSIITVKVIYCLTGKKPDKKGGPKAPMVTVEEYVTLATIKCSLRNVDWSQPHQHFHWDECLGTDDALHWEDGDLAVIPYQVGAVKQAAAKPTKGPDKANERVNVPEVFTCHLSFGIQTING